MNGQPMRASDRDRDEAVRVLSEHYADGRLDHDEFDARMTRASAATYLHELDPLFADLPPRSGPPAPVRGRSASVGPHPPAVLAVVLVPAVLAALLATIVLTHGHAFWLLLPLWWFGMGVARRRAWQRQAAAGTYAWPHRRLPGGSVGSGWD